MIYEQGTSTCESDCLMEMPSMYVKLGYWMPLIIVCILYSRPYHGSKFFLALSVCITTFYILLNVSMFSNSVMIYAI
jgi:hypothetical protein